MSLSKIVFAAAALALSSSAAFAHTPSRAEASRAPAMPVAMERTVGTTSIFGLRPSEPTIWGHKVGRSSYVFDERSTPHDQAGGR
jgi:hypothetical protein